MGFFDDLVGSTLRLLAGGKSKKKDGNLGDSARGQADPGSAAVYTMDQPGPVICMYVCMYVWGRCPTHKGPQIHLLWPSHGSRAAQMHMSVRADSQDSGGQSTLRITNRLAAGSHNHKFSIKNSTFRSVSVLFRRSTYSREGTDVNLGQIFKN